MAAKTNTHEEKVSVFVPKISGEDQTFFVGINGKNWLIPRGRYVEVPKHVAEIVNQHNRMTQMADDHRIARQKQNDVIQGV